MKFLFDLWFHGILIHKISKWSDQGMRTPSQSYDGVRILVPLFIKMLQKKRIFRTSKQLAWSLDWNNPTILYFVWLYWLTFCICFVSTSYASLIFWYWYCIFFLFFWNQNLKHQIWNWIEICWIELKFALIEKH